MPLNIFFKKKQNQNLKPHYVLYVTLDRVSKAKKKLLCVPCLRKKDTLCQTSQQNWWRLTPSYTCEEKATKIKESYL